MTRGIAALATFALIPADGTARGGPAAERTSGGLGPAADVNERLALAITRTRTDHEGRDIALAACPRPAMAPDRTFVAAAWLEHGQRRPEGGRAARAIKALRRAAELAPWTDGPRAGRGGGRISAEESARRKPQAYGRDGILADVPTDRMSFIQSAPSEGQA